LVVVEDAAGSGQVQQVRLGVGFAGAEHDDEIVGQYPVHGGCVVVLDGGWYWVSSVATGIVAGTAVGCNRQLHRDRRQEKDVQDWFRQVIALLVNLVDRI
jgi:hypothetical protein